MKIDPKTFVQDYHLNLCIRCGTCTGGCPVKFRSPLNMRRLVRETAFSANPFPLFKRPELWACTTCSTCTLRCPAGVKNVDLIMGIRNFLAGKGEVPSTIRDALERTLLQGNPWGRFRDQGLIGQRILKSKFSGRERQRRCSMWAALLPMTPGFRMSPSPSSGSFKKQGLTSAFWARRKLAVEMRSGGWAKRPSSKNWPRTTRPSSKSWG